MQNRFDIIQRLHSSWILPQHVYFRLHTNYFLLPCTYKLFSFTLYIQTIFFYLVQFLKKLAGNQCSSTRLEIQQESENLFSCRFSELITRIQGDSRNIWQFTQKLNGEESKDSPNLFCKNLNGFTQHSTNF